MCKRFKTIISAFVDSEAAPLEHLALQEHLKSCPQCKADLAEQYKLKNLFEGYKVANIDVDLSKNIMSMITGGSGEQYNTVGGRSHHQFFAATIAMCMVLMMAVMLISHRQDDSKMAKISTEQSVAYTDYVYDHLYDNDIAYQPISGKATPRAVQVSLYR